MACGCRKRKDQQFLWTPPEGSALAPQTYKTELEAKAKMMRKGGSYKNVTKEN